MTPNLGPRIRRTRRRLGWTLQQLAEKTGFTRSLISKIETGKTVPPVATLMKIAAALGVPVANLLEDDDAPTTVQTPAASSRRDMVRSDKGYHFRMLASKRAEKMMQPILFDAERGKITPQTMTHAGEEFIYVIDGRMKYRVGDITHELGPGDSLYFDAEQPHELEPITKRVRFLAIFTEATPTTSPSLTTSTAKK